MTTLSQSFMHLAKRDTIIATVLMSMVVIALAIIGVGALITYQAWAAVTLWAWFMVPIFGVPALSIPAAIGVGMALRALRGHGSPPKDKDTSFWPHILTPLIALAVGYFLKNYL